MTCSLEEERRWWVLFCAALLVGCVLRVLVYVLTGWTILDGLIGFRFAEQFSAGHGLVFNAGERVSGNTSVLFTLLLGLAGVCHLSIPVFSRIAGIGCDLLTVLLLTRILSFAPGTKSPAFRLGLPGAIFLFPLTFPYSVSGMETSFYVMLIFFLIDRTLRKQDWKYCLAGGLLMYCRPDGVIFVAASLLFLWISTRSLPWRSGLVFFGIGLSYLAFNYLYYGSAVPNTLLTKAVAYHDSIRENFHFIAGRFLKSDILLTILLGLMLAVIVWLRKTLLVSLLGISLIVFFLFLLTAPHLRSWYVIPFLYLGTLVIGIGLGAFVDSQAEAIPRLVPLTLFAAYVLACGLSLKFLVREFREIRRFESVTRIEPGEWLNKNTPPDAKVFVTALELGYYSKRHTLDSPGLVTPAVWKMLKQNPSLDLFQQADALKVDYAVIPLGGGKLLPNFKLIREYKCVPPVQSFDIGYGLYQRVGS
jgi:hypothetical protein